MKRWKRLVLILMVITLLGAGTTAQAASKDVTKKYKKQVSKMLKNFDFYLG